jgi:V/A-type H+-transporting ATPase subunit F
MYKMAVVGDRESVLIFKAFGAEVFGVDVTEALENQKLINRLAKESYAVILITEQAAQYLLEALEHYRKEVLPAILIIPSGDDALGIAEKLMKQNVERAVGVDILQPEN